MSGSSEVDGRRTTTNRLHKLTEHSTAIRPLVRFITIKRLQDRSGKKMILADARAPEEIVENVFTSEIYFSLGSKVRTKRIHT